MAFRFSDPITNIPLVGPKAAKKLEKLDIGTIEDILYHFPSRYLDYGKTVKITNLSFEKAFTIKADVKEIRNIYTKFGKRLTKAVVSDNSGELIIWWFNQHYITQNIKEGQTFFFSGKLGNFSGKPALVSPEYERVGESSERIHTTDLVPIYPETGGVTSKWLRSRIKTALKNTEIEDSIPSEIIQKNNFNKLHTALQNIHFPKEKETSLKKAKERLSFDELFLGVVKGLYKRQVWKKEKKAPLIEKNQSLLKDFVKSLPFTLTSDQERVIKEIVDNMQKNTAMNRLLQGDVGCGKTVVAAAGALLACSSGYNTLYMAPTQILAQQHAKGLENFLKRFNIKVELVKRGSKKREETKKTKQSRGVLYVGTHALLFRKNLENVGLVIIDEQHRFGVKQRAKLSSLNKKEDKQKVPLYPHTLTMTATPIPRSLALTMYGDLDLSSIEEMPKGRIPTTTWLVPNYKRANACTWLEKTLLETKGQAFWVCPFIEESSTETLQSVKAASTEFQQLQETFSKLRLGLLHGRLKMEEKDKILQKFRKHEIDLLVTTPVVEVGVDIPKANIIVVEGAERFGLASLHQLRGRVGRGNQESFCLLFTTKEEFEKSRRLKAMEKVHNGIKLAKLDLKIRGVGELYGTAQHGKVEFKIASFSDTKLLSKAQKAASQIVPNIMNYPKLYEKIKEVETIAGN